MEVLRHVKNRFLSWVVAWIPGERTWRVRIHRLRGVRIGKHCGVSRSAMLETSYPNLIEIGDYVYIGVRVTILAHFNADPPKERRLDKDLVTVRIADRVFIGPGAIIMPHVTIGEGAVISAGSVVTRSVPAHTLVQGNPAQPVARCGVDLGLRTNGEGEVPLREFYKRLKPLQAGGDNLKFGHEVVDSEANQR